MPKVSLHERDLLFFLSLGYAIIKAIAPQLPLWNPDCDHDVGTVQQNLANCGELITLRANEPGPT